MFPIKEERDLNSNQNNNRGKGGGNKRNMTAIVSILLWALVLTLLVNLATSRLQQANSVEVSYGQFRQLIMQDAVESVVMSSGKYTFTLKEGYSLSVGEDGEVTVRTPEEGGQDSQAAQTPPGERDHRRSAGPAPVGRDSPPSSSRSRARIRPRAPAAGNPWSTSAPPITPGKHPGR